MKLSLSLKYSGSKTRAAREKIFEVCTKMGQTDLDNVHKLVTDVEKAEEGVKEENSDAPRSRRAVQSFQEG